jgi:hypothetical protein
VSYKVPVCLVGYRDGSDDEVGNNKASAGSIDNECDDGVKRHGREATGDGLG